MLKKKSLPKKAPAPVKAERKFNTLEDVVNKKLPFTIIYSGVENETYFDLLYKCGIRDFLMSYLYITRKRLSIARLQDMKVRLFIDSGAYTFMSSPEYANYTIDNWETYIEQYLAWGRRNKEIIFAMADLDLQTLVGSHKVKEWRRKYFEPFMLETGVPICFVWHEIDGLEEFEKMCQRYPYVGVSWTVENNAKGEALTNQLIKIATKYSTVIHGFGMTQTSKLLTIPLYTCDSTTWLAGLKYGEMNYWTGTKMTRLKKDIWKGEKLPKILEKYRELSEDKLLKEDVPEMIKANVFAFIEAERFIRAHSEHRMYWLRPRSKIRTELSRDLFPPIEDFYLEVYPQDKLEQYGTELNINIESPSAIECLGDMSVFCNWNDPDFASLIAESYTPEVVQEKHDMWINTIVTEYDLQVEDLINFFTECALGQNTTLLYLDTGFDRQPKERDAYIEDDDYEFQDISAEEMHERLSHLLPMNENTELDDLEEEVFNNTGIVPVRDNLGRFVKGQIKVKKPKKIYSDKFPKLVCDTCYAGQACPEYKAGKVCAFNKMFARFDTRDEGDIVRAMQSMADLNLQRLQRASIFEMLYGGIPDGNVSSLIDQNMRLLSQLKGLYDNGGTEILKYTKTMKSDGSVEEVASVKNPGGNSGILDTLFASLKSAPNEDKDEREDSVVVVNKEEDKN